MANHEGRARAAELRREARAAGYHIRQSPEDGLWRPERMDGVPLDPPSEGFTNKLRAWWEATDRACRSARQMVEAS